MECGRGDEWSEAHAYVSPLTLVSPIKLWQDTFGSVALILELRESPVIMGVSPRESTLGGVDNSPYTHTHPTPSTWLLWQASTFQVLVSSFVLAPDLRSHRLGIHHGVSQLTASLLFCNGLVVLAELHLALPSLPFPFFFPSNYSPLI